MKLDRNGVEYGSKAAIISQEVHSFSRANHCPAIQHYLASEAKAYAVSNQAVLVKVVKIGAEGLVFNVALDLFNVSPLWAAGVGLGKLHENASLKCSVKLHVRGLHDRLLEGRKNDSTSRGKVGKRPALGPQLIDTVASAKFSNPKEGPRQRLLITVITGFNKPAAIQAQLALSKECDMRAQASIPPAHPG